MSASRIDNVMFKLFVVIFLFMTVFFGFLFYLTVIVLGIWLGVMFLFMLLIMIWRCKVSLGDITLIRPYHG